MIIISILLFGVGVLVIAAFDMFKEIDRTWGPILGYAAVAFFFGYGVFNLVTAFQGSKSFCDVYENVVVGKTGLSYRDPKAPMQDFEISFQEIMNVTESGKTLLIYTEYATYEVLALKNREKAAKEIRARMTGKNSKRKDTL